MTQMLKPNEKAEYQKGAGKIKVFDVNTEYDTAWKNGEIIFRNHPMDKVLKTLERQSALVGGCIVPFFTYNGGGWYGPH